MITIVLHHVYSPSDMELGVDTSPICPNMFSGQDVEFLSSFTCGMTSSGTPLQSSYS